MEEKKLQADPKSKIVVQHETASKPENVANFATEGPNPMLREMEKIKATMERKKKYAEGRTATDKPRNPTLNKAMTTVTD